MQRLQLWRLWRSLPLAGRAAFFVGGLMRAANQRAEGEIGSRSSPDGCDTCPRCRRRWSPTAH